ncbi:ANTAR domain-containing protein [Pseudonocardia nantongensis]|uniref:GAF and ANTAR domain-containing protein n=1 Tax=Pseudonocardia nantongensis TaxID=1181885 RepID=UPI003978B63D
MDVRPIHHPRLRCVDGAEPARATSSSGSGHFGPGLAEMVADWHAAADEDSAAGQITAAALGTVTGAESAGIAGMHGRGRLTGHGPTDDTAATLGRLHTALDDGPCRHTLRDGLPLRIRDMTTETRWPEFTARAAELGVGGMLCLPLRAAGRDLGTLNLYARTPGAAPDGDTEELTVFTTHAALALHAHAERAHLGRAVQSRDRIGQAKGILMARHHLTAEQAFARLVAASQAANIKLTEVADWLVDEQQHRAQDASHSPMEHE